MQRRTLSSIALPLAAFLVVSSGVSLVYADPPDTRGDPQRNSRPADPPGGGQATNRPSDPGNQGGGQANRPSDTGRPSDSGKGGQGNKPGQGNPAKDEKAGKGSLALSIQGASSSEGRGSHA